MTLYPVSHPEYALVASPTMCHRSLRDDAKGMIRTARAIYIEYIAHSSSPPPRRHLGAVHRPQKKATATPRELCDQQRESQIVERSHGASLRFARPRSACVHKLDRVPGRSDVQQ